MLSWFVKLMFYIFLFIAYMTLLILFYNIQSSIIYEESSVAKVDNEEKNNIKYTNTDYVIEDNILSKTRRTILKELKNYNWKNSKVDKLEGLILEFGGRPLKTLIISPWRSGANYLGGLLSTLPGVLYYFEPFTHHKAHIEQYNDNTNSVNSLKTLLKCENFNSSDLNIVGTVVDRNDTSNILERPIYYDSRMWSYCQKNQALCFNPHFRERYCALFPFHVVKDVDLKPESIEEILKEKSLSVRVVVLIRDPRAVTHSRLNVLQCKAKTPKCAQVTTLCQDMINYHEVSKRLLQRYSGRVKVMRFEDIVAKPDSTVRELLKFMGLDLMESAQGFLNKGPWVTSNDAFNWTRAMDSSLITRIQNMCRRSMQLWGYVPYQEMRDENISPPITNPIIETHFNLLTERNRATDNDDFAEVENK